MLTTTIKPIATTCLNFGFDIVFAFCTCVCLLSDKYNLIDSGATIPQIVITIKAAKLRYVFRKNDKKSRLGKQCTRNKLTKAHVKLGRVYCSHSSFLKIK